MTTMLRKTVLFNHLTRCSALLIFPMWTWCCMTLVPLSQTLSGPSYSPSLRAFFPLPVFRPTYGTPQLLFSEGRELDTAWINAITGKNRVRVLYSAWWCGCGTYFCTIYHPSRITRPALTSGIN